MEAVENLNLILESLLFTAGRPLKAKDFSKVLEMEETVVKEALIKMVADKKDLGIILLESSEGFQLVTNSKFSTQVKNFLNTELREKLTDATVEVLAIIAYRQPISKAEIEAIRGVNSQYSLRNLLMRGMIEKVANPNDARSVMYQTTTEFLMHMGLTTAKELPEFEKLVEQIKLPDTPALSQADVSTDLIPENEKPQSLEPEVTQTETKVDAIADPVKLPAEIAVKNVEAPQIPEEKDEDLDEEDDSDEDDDDEE